MILVMKVVALAEAKARLSAVVDDVASTGERVTITRNGLPAAVVVSPEEWAQIEETMFWSAVPEIEEAVREARREVAAGETFTNSQVRAWVEAGMPGEGPSR